MDTRVIDFKERERRFREVKVCGANQGRHDYIPIEWVKREDTEMVKTLLCVVCFQRVSMKTLFENFPEARI